MLMMKQLNFRLSPFLIMHKNELKKSYIIATIAISGFLLLSVAATGSQITHQAFAQGGTGMTNSEQFNNAASSNNTNAAPSSSTPTSTSSQNAPSSSTSSPSGAVTPNELPSSQGTSSGSSSGQTTNTSGQNEPPLNKNVVWQGFISSEATKIPGAKGQTATIL